MNEVLVALVGAVGLVVVALISNRGRQHAKAAREQVQNSHQTNLRDELDTRHGENVEKLDGLLEWQQEHQGQSMRGYTRITRLELLVLPAITLGLLATVYRTVRRLTH